jgi:hypothetical protein
MAPDVALRLGATCVSGWKVAVQAIVVVTGDSDLAPAFSFARREAVRVILCRLGHGVRRELAVHADRDMEIVMPAAATHGSFEAEAA